ncbi:MAG: hypothetical protein ABR616_09985 [Dermatophilaceae bacterium]
MAEKTNGRWEERRLSEFYPNEGIGVTVTRRGIEVDAAADSGYLHVGSMLIPWDEIDAMRARVEAGDPTPLVDVLDPAGRR